MVAPRPVPYDPQTPRGFHGRTVVLALLAVLLVVVAWRIIVEVSAEDLAEEDPEASLTRANNPTAMAVLVGRRLSAAATREDIASAVASARLALIAGPLEDGALAAIALAEDLEGNEDRARTIMDHVDRRTLRNTQAQVWLLNRTIAAGEFQQGLTHADALLRVQPKAIAELMPALLPLVADPLGRDAVVAQLAQSPPWRSSFLAELPARISEPTAVFALLSELAKGQSPPTEAEVSPLLDRLIDLQQFDLAYVVWMHFLPPDRKTGVAYAYNGDFETPISEAVFDWRITNVIGARTDVVDTTDVGFDRTLRVEFANTRVRYADVAKLLILPPGSYRLSGMVKTAALETQRGMTWRITCAGGKSKPGNGRRLAETKPIKGNLEWTKFTADFEVPSEACPAQWMRLELAARVALDQQVSGAIWYDKLAVERLTAGAQPLE